MSSLIDIETLYVLNTPAKSSHEIENIVFSFRLNAVRLIKVKCSEVLNGFN